MFVRSTFLILLPFSINFVHIDAHIFLWSSHPLELSVLKYFGNDELDALKEVLNHPKTVIFKGEIGKLGAFTNSLFKGKHTGYIPNGHLEIDDAIQLSGDYNTLQENVKRLENEDYLGIVIDESTTRRRRQLEETDEEIEYDDDKIKEDSGDPVFYIPDDGKGIVYSSKSLTLKVNMTKYNLGASKFVSLDTRDTYTRLSATIPFDDKDKVILRFKFDWRSGYWSLSLVELEYIDSKKYSLLANRGVMVAARNFSYHCTGETTFRDTENLIELTLYDFQAQPDAKNGRFNDAYDCTPFTTVPIWSGIFVVSIITIGLAIGLNALGSIKITHGCENVKLKELCIAAGLD